MEIKQQQNEQQNKQQLRKEMQKIRNNMCEEDRLLQSQDITEQVVSHCDFLQAKEILVYVNYKSEVITKGIIDYAFYLGKKVYCPKITGEHEMEFYEITSSIDLEAGYQGIKEPSTIDSNGNPKQPYQYDATKNPLMIMPGLAFDLEGHRMGYGKGFYDTYITNHFQGIKMAIGFDEQVIKQVPTDQHDQQYDLFLSKTYVINMIEED